MLMKAPCFVCSQEQSFSPKTISKFTDHVYNYKIDFDQLKEKNERIEQLEVENYNLKKKVSKLLEELESQTQPQFMKKLKINMSDDCDDICSTPTKNVIQPPNQSIQQQIQIQPSNQPIQPQIQIQIQPPNQSIQPQIQTQPQTQSGEISIQTPTKSQPIAPNNSDYDISVGLSKEFIENQPPNIQEMLINSRMIPRLELNEKDAGKCYFSCYRSLVEIKLPSLSDQDFATCKTESEIIQTLQKVTHFKACIKCASSKVRFELFNGKRSIKLCSTGHVVDPLITHYIAKHLGIADIKHVNSPIGKETFQKCRACKNMCNDTIRVRGQDSLDIGDNYTKYCSLACFFKHSTSVTTKDWQKLTSKGEIIKEEVVNEKNNEDCNDEEKKTKSVPETPQTRSKKQIYDIMNDLEQYDDMIGISENNFLDLLKKVEGLTEEKKNNVGRKQSYKTNEKLFISLFHMRHYPRIIILNKLFGIKPSSFIRIFDEILDILYQLSLENFENVFKNRFDETSCLDYDSPDIGLSTITMVVDGSEQQISIPLDEDVRNYLYSGKKGKSTLTLLVYCCPKSGKILHIGSACGGSKNDINLFERDKEFISKLEKEKEFILGDRGFVGVDRIVLTIQKGKRDNEQKKTDISQKSIRIIIENVFAKIKTFYITSLPLRYKFSVGSIDTDNVQEKHHKTWCAVGFIVNLYKPIRNLNNK
ncbi:hypothetical protein ACTFIY_005486 [Dictyostelium cf. discoideum]